MTGEPNDTHEPQPPPDGAPSPPPPHEAPRARRLARRRDDQMIGGVASGLADYLDADPSLVRIAWVALAIVTSGLGVIAYLVAWVVMPEEPAVAEGNAATSGRERREPRDRGPWGGVVLGLILIGVGAVALLAQLDIPTPPWRVILSAALVLVGLAMVAAARRGLNGGLLVLALLLTGVLASRAALPIGNVDSGFGDRRVVAEAPGRLERDYGHTFGSLRIDVTDASMPAGTTRLEASIAFGDLRITVPPGVGLRVTASTAFGSTRVLEDELGAFGQRELVTPGYDQAAKRLELRVNTVFGSTRISRGEP